MKKSFARFYLIFLLFAQTAHAYDASGIRVGDKYYEEKSYALAAAEYEKLLQAHAVPEERMREVTFKWSDCVIQGKDEANREKAEKALDELTDSKDHDRWWAEAGISLASGYIARDPWNKAAIIKKYLDDGRDYWAGSDDVETARVKFIRISFMLADFETSRSGWYVTDIKPMRLEEKETRDSAVPVQGNEGLQVLFEEILKIAASDADKAKAHYGLAMSLMQNYSSDAKLKDKAVKEFRTVIEKFSGSEWADESYFQLGVLYENQSDFLKAEQTWRDFLSHFRAGESKHVDEVTRRLAAIVDPAVSVSVGNTFVPDSEIQFSLNWRNAKEAEITLYKMDLTKELGLITPRYGREQVGYTSYQELLRNLVETTGRYQSLPVALTWKQALEDDGKHTPHSLYKGIAEWRMEKDAKEADPKAGVLQPGAYLLVANAGSSKPAYDLVLVSGVAMASKVAKDSALFFTFDAKTGKPAAKAEVRFLYSYADERGATRWAEGGGTSDENGLLNAPLKNNDVRNYNQQHSIFATAAAEGGQSFLQNNYYQNNSGRGEWSLYAFSNRPAYRPGELVSYKGILRHYEGGAYAGTPGMQVKARIFSPQGAEVKQGVYTLNDYGAFDDTLTLDDRATLGEYRMELYTADLRTHLSSSPLFRLEEYKLPEFVVNVKPEPKDEKATGAGFRLGDTVSLSVDAQYYFGGPVANAQLEYLVYQQPYYHQYQPVRPYAWYYKDLYPQNNYYGGYGQFVKKETLTTDAQGKAHFKIETPKDSANDLQYHIEVRVVDQSRREIRATSDLKVTKNAFFAYLEPKQNLYRKGDKAQVAIKTMTANDEPVAVEGKVRLLRNSWHDGSPVSTMSKQVIPEGYNGQEVLTKFVKTNEKGEAVFEFEPEDDGYYEVEFTGFDDGREVTGNVNVYVCDASSVNIGYKYNGLQIITEKDTYGVGDTAHAMIVTDKPDSWVLLTTEADGIYDYQMLHLEGSVKLVEIPVKPNFTPNVFLNALGGDHYQVKMNTLQIIVPPVEKFLNVKVTSDKAVYQPQEDGTFDVTVTDKDGRPVSAEIALGLTDAAVYYIQDEIAPDIRQFFYGEKRQQTIQTQVSFYQRPYVNLVRGENNELMTDEERSRRKQVGQPVDMAIGAKNEKDIGRDDALREGGIGGAYAQNALAAPASAAASTNSPVAEEKAKGMLDNKVDALKKSARSEIAQKEAAGKPTDGGEEPAQVRNDFRSTVVWLPSVKTDASGKAVVKAKFPDSLTTWRLTARADTAQTAIGTMTHEVKSNKDLMIRLEAPRFFTERDQADVSALIDNLTDAPITVTPSIKAKGIVVTGLYHDGEFAKGEQASRLDIPAHGQKRVDWAVAAEHEGEATFTVSARAGKLSDAMEKTYPIIPHGIEKFIAQSIVLKGDGEQTKEFTVTIPKERIKRSASLRLMLSPSMAANLMDALPYLADYPYGCVEQTMSRFLPAVIVAKTMVDLGISPQNVESYIEDVLDARGDPQGHPGRRRDATYSRLRQMTDESLKRLYDFQHADGGWGWWKEGESDRFMSAYVVWGMSLAHEAGVEVKSDVLARAVHYLQVELVQEQDAPDMLAWMLQALAEAGSRSGFEEKQRARLWEMRNKLNPYTRALFALSEHRRGEEERSRILAQNIINGIEEDKENATAHWGESGINYRFSEGGVEATAFNISALAQIDPQSPYLEPAVKWLSLNRRGASWKNTRDTAIAILGLTDYLKATHELSPDYAYKVWVNGVLVREGKVAASNVFSFDRILNIPAEALHDGGNSIRITMNGKGALYASAYAKYFTLEEPITRAGNEIFVTRKYFIQSVKETLMKGYTNDWKPLADGDTVKSGDRIRVDVTLDAKNNYEYLLAEDYKPAGLEAVELKSGPGEAITLDREGRETDARTPLYEEFRDQKAAFFIAHLKQGRHLLRYELRAETPGSFHAMPDQAHAMYVPEIRANSDEMRIDVKDPDVQKSPAAQ